MEEEAQNLTDGASEPESGSRVAGKPESEVKRKESGRRSPEPNTDGAGEPESGSRVAGKPRIK